MSIMMFSKPEKCNGCPLYGDGTGFVPDRLVPGAKVMVLAQNPGADEENGRRLVEYVGRDRVYEQVEPQPLIGASGYALENIYLPRASLYRGGVSYGNVLKCRAISKAGVRTNELPKGDTLRQAVKHCTTSHLVVPPGTSLLVGHGQVAWDYLVGTRDGAPDKAISEWRGYLDEPGGGRNGKDLALEVPLRYATLHTASLFRVPRMKPAAMADWAKIPRILKGEWPRAVPHLLQVPAEVPPDSVAILAQLAGLKRVALDTEFHYTASAIKGHHPLTAVGVAGKTEAGEWRGFQVDCRLLSEKQVREFVEDILSPHVLTRMPVIFQNGAADIPVLHFSGGPEFGGYNRVEDLMLLHFLLYSEQPHDLHYIASVYGYCNPFQKLVPGVDLLRDNKGDVIDTFAAFERLEREGLADPSTYKLYREELVPLIPIHTQATQVGVRVDKVKVQEAMRDKVTQMQEALKMARAYAGYNINPGSVGGTGQVANFLYNRLKMPVQKDRVTKKPTVDADAVATLRKKLSPEPDLERENREGLTVDEAMERCEKGANPLLESRVVYASALQEVSHYLAPVIG